MANEADVIQLTLTLKMTTAQVVQKSVTVSNNRRPLTQPTSEAVHPDIFCQIT